MYESCLLFDVLMPWGHAEKILLFKTNLEQNSNESQESFCLTTAGVGSNPTTDNLVFVCTYYELWAMCKSTFWMRQNTYIIMNSNRKQEAKYAIDLKCIFGPIFKELIFSFLNFKNVFLQVF